MDPAVLPAAPLSKRLGALLIDFAVLLIPITVVQTLTLEAMPALTGITLDQAIADLTSAALSPETAGPAMGTGFLFLLLAALLGFLVLDFYYILFEYYRGATPGKKLLGLKVVSLKGPRLTFGQCVWREVLRHIDVSLVLPGLISVLVTRGHRRLGDLIAKTQVIDGKSAGVGSKDPSRSSAT